MRRVTRPMLPERVQTYLDRRQWSANERRALGMPDIERDWKTARQTKALHAVLGALQLMMGDRQRCMYCVDSHGSDIEHFRPKARFPKRTYLWPNMLLCCSECGRFKGSQFPMMNGQPLLIDPTAEDPWQHLDFDPDTGNLTARFDLHSNDWSAKGAHTVQVLQLDRREAMAAGYVNTYQQLAGIVRTSVASLGGGAMTAPALLAALRDADDHGLLAWCFNGGGQEFKPFLELRHQYPQAWEYCKTAVA